MKTLLEKIKNNGFSIQLDGDNFTVSPKEKLTEQQHEFLRANKSQIMDELLLTTVYNLFTAFRYKYKQRTRRIKHG